MTYESTVLYQPLDIGELEANLNMHDVAVPEPAKGELLVRMHASSINIDDIHIAEGTFFGGLKKSRASAQQPVTPGVDVAGTVEKIGEGVSGFAVGDAVMGILGPKALRGAWSQYCCLSTDRAIKKPGNYSFAEAAACAVAGKTAATAVMSSALQSGQTAIVVGASGGIGSIIVQILSRQGVRVIGVCSGRNAALVGSLGADTIVDYTRGPYGEQLSLKADVVIDCVGGVTLSNRGFLSEKNRPVCHSCRPAPLYRGDFHRHVRNPCYGGLHNPQDSAVKALRAALYPGRCRQFACAA